MIFVLCYSFVFYFGGPFKKRKKRTLKDAIPATRYLKITRIYERSSRSFFKRSFADSLVLISYVQEFMLLYEENQITINKKTN